MEKDSELQELTKRILASQRFAVLATQSGVQPYTNLVAFAEAHNLRSLLFVTGKGTSKYSNALASKKVAVLIDSRTNQASDVNNAIAVTALGTVEEVALEKKESLSEVYLSKHPQLVDFLHDPANALMEVVVTNYIVASFDSVRRLRIG